MKQMHQKWKACLQEEQSRAKVIQDKKEISQEAQEALLASQILWMIMKYEGSQDLYSPSLKERIASLNVQYPKWEINSKVRASFLKLILTTVNYENRHLPVFNYPHAKLIFQNPETFQQRLQKQSFKWQQQPNIMKRFQHIEPQAFMSAPNLTTKRLFDCLIDLQPSSIVQDGQDGFELEFVEYDQQDYLKSYSLVYGGQEHCNHASLMLFSRLTYAIHKFIYKSTLPGNNQERLQEIKLLKDDIMDDLPRYWYWNINWNKPTSEGFSLNNIFLDQASELPVEVRQKLSKIQTFQQFKQQLLKQYSPTLKHAIIIDDLCKIHVKFDRHKILTPYAQIDSIFEKISTIGHLLLVADSSFSYELQIVGHYYTKPKLENLQKYMYYALEACDLDRTYTYDSKWSLTSKNDYFQFFWSEIQRMIPNTVSLGVLQRIKSGFNQTFQAAKMKDYYRFQYIADFINLEQTHECIYKTIDVAQNVKVTSQIANQFKQMWMSFQKFCFKVTHEKMMDLLKRRRNKKQHDDSNKVFEHIKSALMIKHEQELFELAGPQLTECLTTRLNQKKPKSVYSRYMDKIIQNQQKQQKKQQ